MLSRRIRRGCRFLPRGVDSDDQLRFSAGDRLLVLHKSSPHWCWAELHGLSGYVPSNHLQARAQQQVEQQVEVDGPWQDEEYYGSYGTLKLRLEMLSDRRSAPTAPLSGDECSWTSAAGQESSASSVPVSPSLLRPIAQREFFSKPKFNHESKPEDCLSAPCDVITLDMHTVQVADLEKMTGEFKFGVENQGTLHGFTAWFSAQFRSLETGGTPAELNTGPHSNPTHWKRTLFMLDTPVAARPGDSICGTLQLRRIPVWRRHMTVTLQWSVHGDGAETCKTYNKSFPMWR